MKHDYSVKDITKTAMMATLTFIGIYLIKIPSLHGYTHLGDCMIFLSVLLLGGKKGALAGGIGASLSDFVGGYIHWVVPTFFIKYIMAMVMGLCMEKIMPNAKYNWLVGAIAGGMVQLLLYTLVKIPLYGMGYAIGGIVPLASQTVTGIVLTTVFVLVFQKAHLLQQRKELSK